MSQHNPPPPIPGSLLPSRISQILKQRISSAFSIPVTKFPGAQPISFAASHITTLLTSDYFVSEKTDGTRVLLYTTTRHDNPNVIETFLIDRKYDFYYMDGMWFPGDYAARPKAVIDTMLDGELIVDVENGVVSTFSVMPLMGKEKLRYYAFDCMLYLGKVLVEKPLTKRLGTLDLLILKPYFEFIAKDQFYASRHPFKLHRKIYESAYNVKRLLERMQRLKHKSDGLIFTSVDAPYMFGTNPKMLKWKPKEENSVDFRVVVVTRRNNNSDMVKESREGEEKEVRYELFISGNHGKEVYVGDLHPDASLLNQWKHTSPNGKIIECSYDASGWKFMRYRDDKDVPNHSSTYDSILKSIEDNVEQSALLGLMDEIKRNWKNRENSIKEGSVKRGHVEDDKMEDTTANVTDDIGKRHKRDDDIGQRDEFSGNDSESRKEEKTDLVKDDETDRNREKGPKEQKNNDESKDEEKGG